MARARDRLQEGEGLAFLLSCSPANSNLPAKDLMKPTLSIKTSTFAATTVTLALATACATAPLRTESSTSGIRAAQEVGASDVPQAALHLQLAQEELKKAEKLSADGEEEMAASMLTRAEADAELAVLLSREHAQKAEAEAAMKRVRELRLAHE